MFKRFFAGGLSAILSAGLLATPVFAADDLINTPYEYPVLPGTEEWAEFDDFLDMIEVCQIPVTKSSAMSTEALVESIIDYPLWPIYFSYDTTVVYDTYKVMLDALEELEGREDADKILLDYYQKEEVVTAQAFMRSNGTLDKHRIDYFEILLAQPVFQDNLTETELDELADAIVEKQSIRETETDIYAQKGMFYQITESEDTSSRVEPRLSVKTPRGSNVYVYTDSTPMDQNRIKGINETYSKYFPKAILRSNPTYRYNCHSYTWYMASTSNPYWMPNPILYTTDGSYKEVYPTKGTVPQNGLAVVFEGVKAEVSPKGLNPNKAETWHSVSIIGRYSGTATNTNNYNLAKCKSKWGYAGLYEHALNYHPWRLGTAHFFKYQ